MAKSNAAIVISMLLIASFSSLSDAVTLNGVNLGVIHVTGLLTCNLGGNVVGSGPPVSGATAVLSCAGANTNLGQAVTNPAGVIDITVKIVDTILFDPSRCLVKVNLPVATCSVFPPDGVLTASLRLVNIAQSAVGNVANFATDLFRYSVI